MSIFDVIKKTVSTVVNNAKAKSGTTSSGNTAGSTTKNSASQNSRLFTKSGSSGGNSGTVSSGNTAGNSTRSGSGTVSSGNTAGNSTRSGSGTVSSGYYDPNKDYSIAIEEARRQGQDISQLERERQNKINAMYGGKEPNMIGSDKTYSSRMGGGFVPGGSSGAQREAAIREQMEQAAAAGEWDKVGPLVNQLGIYDGDNSSYDFTYANQVWDEIAKKYGYNAKDYYDRQYDKAFGNGSSDVWDATNGAVKSAEEWDRLTGGAALPSGGSGSYGGGNGSYDGGGYPSGGGAGGTAPGGGYGSFEDFLNDSGYGKYNEATQAAIRAAVEKAIGGYRDQMNTTNLDSDELARQAYIAKMQSQRNLDQQLSASGLAGGMADSQRLEVETNYQNQLKDIELQRDATIRELESAITNAQLTGDMQTAQELSDYLQSIQSQWASYIQFQKSMDNQNYWNQVNLDNSNYWNRQEMEMQGTENARSWVMRQLSAGIMPDDASLSAAGISRAAAQQQLMQMGGGEIGGTTTGGGTVSGGGNTLRRSGGGYNNGSLSRDQIMEMQRSLGVTPDGYWGKNSTAAAGGLSAEAAWAEYLREKNGGGTAPTTAGGDGLSQGARQILSVLTSRQDMLGNDGVEREIARYVTNGQLTDAEARYLFEHFGYDPNAWLE